MKDRFASLFDFANYDRKKWILFFGASLFVLLMIYLFVDDSQKFRSSLIFGAVEGSILAVAASGLVVTYTTSGIFNFAHGAIGMFIAFLFWSIHQSIPFIPAFIIAVFVVAPILGALLERFIIRRFEGSPVATTLMITVALLVVFFGGAQKIWSPTEPRTAGKFLPNSSVELLGVNVTGHQIVSALTSILAAIALYIFLSKTRTGLAMRAVVDNRNLVSLNGGRPNQMSMLSWAIGASLAGLAGILIAGQGTGTIEHLLLTLLVINAFSAALLGRLQSIPATFAGAFLVGFLKVLYTFFKPTGSGENLQSFWDGLDKSIPIIFLFLALMFLPVAKLSAGRLVTAQTPRVPGFRESAAGLAVLIVVTALVSSFLGVGDQARVAPSIGLAIVMLSLVPLIGYSAQISLAAMSFAGIGALVAGKFGDHGLFGNGSPVGWIVAAAIAAVAGALVALPALRLQGLYLALTTLSFAVLLDNALFDRAYGFGSGGALEVPRLNLGLAKFESEYQHIIVGTIVFAILGMLVLHLRRGPFGRRLAAMRDAPAACATLGLNLTVTKLQVFALSAFIAGIGGVVFAGGAGTAGPNQFLLLQGLLITLYAVVGGITTVSGAAIGGLLVAAAQTQDQQVVFVVVAGAAIALGKNPNGLAFLVSERLGRFAFWRSWFEGPSDGPSGTVSSPTGGASTEERELVGAGDGA